jgi:hypothetical protein
VPDGVAFNRVEIRGAAYGTLAYAPDEKGQYSVLANRARAWCARWMKRRRCGGRCASPMMQEQPIQEIWAYDIHPGEAPKGTFQLSYTVRADASPDLGALKGLNTYIAGRFPPRERATVVAMPTSGVKAAVGAGSADAAGAVRRRGDELPLVHILILSNFGDALPDRPLARAWNYGWENAHDGLDGLAIDLPAIHAKPNAQGLIALNIRVKDPIWPDRAMIDVQVAVPPISRASCGWTCATGS